MARLIKKSGGRDMNLPKDYSHFEKIKKQKNMLHYDKRWHPLRNHILTKFPLCWFCGALASEVHHVEKGTEKFFDESNLVSTCNRCHTNLEMLLIRKSSFIDMITSAGIRLDSWECMNRLRDAFNQKYNRAKIEADKE